MKILIPAKGSSTRVPRKNLQLVWGQPLVQSTIDRCRRWYPTADIFVATDDVEISCLTREAGCEVYDLIAADAEDRRTAIELFQEFLELWPSSECCLCIHVTSPFTFRRELDGAIDDPAPYLCSGYRGVFHMVSDGYSLSQSIPTRTIATGNFVKTYGSLQIPSPEEITERHFVPVSWISAIDVNTPEDLELVRWLAERVAPQDFD